MGYGCPLAVVNIPQGFLVPKTEDVKDVHLDDIRWILVIEKEVSEAKTTSIGCHYDSRTGLMSRIWCRQFSSGLQVQSIIKPVQPARGSS